MATHFSADYSPAGDSGSCSSSCSSRSSCGGSSSRSLGPAFSSSTFSSDCSISSSLLHIPADHNSLPPSDYHAQTHNPSCCSSRAHTAAPLPSPPVHPSPLPFSTLSFGKAGTRGFRMLLVRHDEPDACASRRDGNSGSDGESSDAFQAQQGEGCHVSKQQQREGNSRIVSPWHDIPLYDADCLLHFVCTRPAGTALRHEFATNEDYSPLRVARGSSLATSASATPWNVGSLPQTRQDPEESFEGLPELLGSGAPLEAIDLSPRRVEVGSVYSIKPVAAFAVRSDAGDFAWRVVGVAGDDPAARHVNNADETERYFPGALRRVRAWLESEGAAGSGVLHEGSLGSDAAHMAVARANAAWQLLVDQEVPAPPWTPPPREICASVLAAIWRNKYDLEDGPDCHLKASPAGTAAAAAGALMEGAGLQAGRQHQLGEEDAQSASAAASAVTLASPGCGVVGPMLPLSNVDAHRHSATARRRFASLFRSKSGRFTNARLSSLGSEKERERERCPVPKGGNQSVPAAGPSPTQHGSSTASAALAVSDGYGGSGGSSSSCGGTSGNGRGGGGGSQRLRSIAGDTYDPSSSPPLNPHDRCLSSLAYSSVDLPAASALVDAPTSFGSRACGLRPLDGQPLLHLGSGSSSIAGSSSWSSSGGSSGSSVSIAGGQLPPPPRGTGSHHRVCASLDLLEGGERGPVVEVCDIQHTRHCSVESMLDSAALAAATTANQSPSPPLATSASAASLTYSYSLPRQMGHISPKQMQQQHHYHHHHHHQQKQMQSAAGASFRMSPPMPLGTSHSLRGGRLPRGGVRRPAGLGPLPIPRPPSPLGSATTSPGGILKKSSTLERAGSVIVYDDEDEEDMDAEEEDEDRDPGARHAFRRSSSESGRTSPDRGADFGPLSATSASDSTAKDEQPALSRSTSVRSGSGRRVHFNEEVDLVLLEEVSPGAAEEDLEEDGAGEEVKPVKSGRRRGHVEVAALRLNISLDEEGQGKAVASPRNLLFQCA